MDRFEEIKQKLIHLFLHGAYVNVTSNGFRLQIWENDLGYYHWTLSRKRPWYYMTGECRLKQMEECLDDLVRLFISKIGDKPIRNHIKLD